MKKKDSNNPGNDKDRDDNLDNEGYPLYPPKDDIYNRFKEEQDIDPEDPTRLKEDIPEIEQDTDEVPELDFDILHTDLDIPGADLDDDQEDIGSEDEENNYYSIGGDNHHDLEEDEGLLDEEI